MVLSYPLVISLVFESDDGSNIYESFANINAITIIYRK